MEKQIIPKRNVKINKNYLKDMFKRQINFQKRFYDIPIKKNKFNEYEKLMLTSIIVEAVEAIDWLNWKPWKKTKKKLNRYEFLNEIIDIQHFVINAAIGVGCESDEFYKLFINKNLENADRQKRGY